MNIFDLKQGGHHAAAMSIPEKAALKIEFAAGNIEPAIVNTLNKRNVVVEGWMRIELARMWGYTDFPITEVKYNIHKEAEEHTRLNPHTAYKRVLG